MVFVSVVMITYNHEAFIREAIEGVLMQHIDFQCELVIGEDCSQDNTRSICEEYALKYPEKVRLLPSEKNLGMMPNFIRTLEACIGKYIALCEGDDYWTDPNKLQKQVNFLDSNSDYVIAYHDIINFNAHKQVFTESNIPEYTKCDLTSEELIRGAWLATSTIVFKSVLRTLPNEMLDILNADTFLISLIGRYGKGKYFRDIKPSVYRIHSGGVWSARDELSKILEKRKTYKQLEKFYRGVKEKQVAIYFNRLWRDLAERYLYTSLHQNNFKAIFKAYFAYAFNRNILFHPDRFLYLHKSILKFLFFKKNGNKNN